MLKEIVKRIVIIGIIISLLCLCLRCFVNFKLLECEIGVVAGIFVTALRMSMLSQNIDKVVEMPAKMAQKWAVFGYIGRYTLTAIFLIAVVIYSKVAFVSSVITLILATKMSVYSIKVKN